MQDCLQVLAGCCTLMVLEFSAGAGLLQAVWGPRQRNGEERMEYFELCVGFVLLLAFAIRVFCMPLGYVRWDSW